MSDSVNALLRARLRDYQILWRAAVSHGNPFASPVVRWGGAFIGIATGAVVGMTEGLRGLAVMAWWLASATPLLAWLWRFMPGAVKLASPAYAQLVPQLRQRMIELSCLVCWIGIAGIASAPYTSTRFLGPQLFWIVAFVVGSGLAVAGHRAASVTVIVGCASSLMASYIPAELVALLSHPVVIVLSLPVYAGVIFVAVRAMFPQAGERHWNMLAWRARWADAAGKRDPLVEQMAGKQAKGWYAASLRRDSARRDGKRLMLHALGASAHISEIVVVLAYMAAIVIAIGVMVFWRADHIVTIGLAWVLASLVLVVPLVYCLRIGQLSGGLASEQSLVRLAPAMPAGAAAFNIQLGRILLLQALMVWGVSTAVFLLLAALAGAGGNALLNAASLACMVLPLVAVPLRDYASTRQSAAAAAATLLLISTVGSLVAGGAVNALTDIPVLPVSALVSIGFTIVVVVRGLCTMQYAPCAFPAGRMD